MIRLFNDPASTIFVDWGGGGGIFQVIIYHFLHAKRLVKKGY